MPSANFLPPRRGSNERRVSALTVAARLKRVSEVSRSVCVRSLQQLEAALVPGKELRFPNLAQTAAAVGDRQLRRSAAAPGPKGDQKFLVCLFLEDESRRAAQFCRAPRKGERERLSFKLAAAERRPVAAMANSKTSNALIQQLLKAEEEAEQIVNKAKESTRLQQEAQQLASRRSEPKE